EPRLLGGGWPRARDPLAVQPESPPVCCHHLRVRTAVTRIHPARPTRAVACPQQGTARTGGPLRPQETAVTATEPTVADPQTRFLAHLPRFRAHARSAFRHVRCPDTRADLTAETLALAWRHFAALALRGRRPEAFVTTLALRCSQAVRAGRRLAGSDRSSDALSPVARVRHRFTVRPLGDPTAVTGPVPGDGEELAEALSGNTRTPVPAQVAFRLDFPRWRSGFGPRARAVLDALAAGGRTNEVARELGLSPARVSQMRREFERGWRAFHRTRNVL